MRILLSIGLDMWCHTRIGVQHRIDSRSYYLLKFLWNFQILIRFWLTSEEGMLAGWVGDIVVPSSVVCVGCAPLGVHISFGGVCCLVAILLSLPDVLPSLRASSLWLLSCSISCCSIPLPSRLNTFLWACLHDYLPWWCSGAASCVRFLGSGYLVLTGCCFYSTAEGVAV